MNTKYAFYIKITFTADGDIVEQVTFPDVMLTWHLGMGSGSDSLLLTQIPVYSLAK